MAGAQHQRLDYHDGIFAKPCLYSRRRWALQFPALPAGDFIVVTRDEVKNLVGQTQPPGLSEPCGDEIVRLSSISVEEKAVHTIKKI
jgi:hypothetical protein